MSKDPKDMPEVKTGRGKPKPEDCAQRLKDGTKMIKQPTWDDSWTYETVYHPVFGAMRKKVRKK